MIENNLKSILFVILYIPTGGRVQGLISLPGKENKGPNLMSKKIRAFVIQWTFYLPQVRLLMQINMNINSIHIMNIKIIYIYNINNKKYLFFQIIHRNNVV